MGKKKSEDAVPTADEFAAQAIAEQEGLDAEQIKVDERESSIDVSYVGEKVTTPEELIEQCEIDLNVWEIERIVVNQWPVGGKRRREGVDELWQMQLRQMKVSLRRKSDEQQSLQLLLDAIRDGRDIIIPAREVTANGKRRIALEIAIMDPHMGMECFTPEADQVWNLDLCEQFYLYAVDELIRQAQAVGHIEKILWIFGNDFNHTDNVFNTTTAGTPQPEAVSAHRAMLRGEQLAISAAERMLQNAPVEAAQVPGNHDRLSSYMQGRILNAWYHNHGDFSINADASPFKRFRYGASLVGLEHGHSISPIRLVGVMANEWRHEWADTHYHEWHCGDQHRKGSSKPSVFEEQGVSVEFLPSIVAPNEWHRLKSFNFQKRAAVGYVWDYDCGQTHRLTVNISKYTGQWLGDGYDDWLSKQKDAG